MSELINELIVLFDIDQSLIQLKKRLQAGPEELAHQEQGIAELREQRKLAEQAIREKASAVDACNLEIRSMESEIDDQEAKLHSIKNNKEYKIVTERIKTLKQGINEKENGALAIMEELDALREAFKARQDEVAAAEIRLEELKTEIEAEADIIRTEAKTFKEKRDAQITQINHTDPATMEVYETAFRRGRGVALAEMINAACQVCFRQQSPNVENLVMVGKDLKQCRCAGCGRILYVKQTL